VKDNDKQINAQQTLRAMLEASARLYMVQTHQSRAGTIRHYKILIADQLCKIEDCTVLVCLAIGRKVDKDRKTFNVRGFTHAQDHHNLSFLLHNALKMPAVIPVHVL
jgi:hypothetical protein